MSPVSTRTKVAVRAGAAAGWLSRVSGRGAGATISGRVIPQISPHALEELAALGPMRLRQVDEAQQKVVATARELERKGDITIPKGAGADEVIV